METQVAGVRQGWALRIPGKEGVPQLGKGLPADSLSPGWHQEAFIGGQAQVLSPHGHHRGALLGEKSRRIKWRLPSPNSCPRVLSRPWQGGPGSTRPRSSLVPEGKRLCHPLLRAPLASCHSHMSTFCFQPLLLPCPWTITWWEVTQIFLVLPAPLNLAPRHQACVGQGQGLQCSLISPCVMQRPGLGEKAAQVAGLPAASIMMGAAHLPFGTTHVCPPYTHAHRVLCSPSQLLLAHRNTHMCTA